MSGSVGPDMKVCRISRTQKVEGEYNEVSQIEFHYTVGTMDGVETYTETHEIGLYDRKDVIENFRKAGINAEYYRLPGKLSDRGLFIGRKTNEPIASNHWEIS